MDSKIYIIIPAFNAQETLKKVISDIRRVCARAELVVINDGSTDNSQELLTTLGVSIINNPRNLGVGASLKKGIDFALKNKAEIFVTVGADDQRDSNDIVRLLQELEYNKCDMVLGSKFLCKGQKMPILRKCGNLLFTFILNKIFHSNFSDVTSGFRAFNRKVALGVFDLSDSYAFDVDLCIKTLRRGYAYREVPVRVFYRSDTTKMKNIFLVGFCILSVIIRRKFEEFI